VLTIGRVDRKVSSPVFMKMLDFGVDCLGEDLLLGHSPGVTRLSLDQVSAIFFFSFFLTFHHVN